MSEAEIRPIVLVCGCQKYRPYLDAALTRFERSEWRCIGILGDPTLKTPVLEGNILTLPVHDIYESLPTKIHAAFTWAASTFPASPGIFKTDDDIFMKDISDLVTQVLSQQVLPYWGLRVGMCEAGQIAETRIAKRFTDTSLRPSHPAAHYGFGHGYWVSREVLPYVIAAGDAYCAAFLEDVCTGYVLNAVGITPVRLFLPYIEAPRTPEYLCIR